MTDLDKARAPLDAAQVAREDARLSRVEYAIILVLISAIAVGTWQTFGPSAQGRLSGSAQQNGAAAARTETAQEPSEDSSAEAQSHSSEAQRHSTDSTPPNGS